MHPAPPPPAPAPAPAAPARWRFWCGVVLFVLNEPLGYASLGLCAASSALPHSTLLFVCGAVCYGLSWVMFALGLRFIGRAGVLRIRSRLHRLLARIRAVALGRDACPPATP